MTKRESRRLSILSEGEIDEVFGLPNFSDDERQLYFELSTIERDTINAIRTTSVAVNLILQLGYFKSRRMFFVYELSEIEQDLRYVMRSYFPDLSWKIVKPISKPTRLEQQHLILKLFGYTLCDGTKKLNWNIKPLELRLYQRNHSIFYVSHCSTLRRSAGLHLATLFCRTWFLGL